MWAKATDDSYHGYGTCHQQVVGLLLADLPVIPAAGGGEGGHTVSSIQRNEAQRTYTPIKNVLDVQKPIIHLRSTLCRIFTCDPVVLYADDMIVPKLTVEIC